MLNFYVALFSFFFTLAFILNINFLFPCLNKKVTRKELTASPLSFTVDTSEENELVRASQLGRTLIPRCRMVNLNFICNSISPLNHYYSN